MYLVTFLKNGLALGKDQHMVLEEDCGFEILSFTFGFAEVWNSAPRQLSVWSTIVP